MQHYKNQVSKTAVFTTFAAALLSGTGNSFDISHIENWGPYIERRIPLDIQGVENISSIERLNVKIISEHVENIRNVFNVSMSDLATIFGVSRQMIYKWLNQESIPEQDKQDRIRKISLIADQFQEANISRIDSLLKMKTFNGKSLMNFLITGEDTQLHVEALIKEARIMEDSYKKANISASKSKPTDDWKTSFAIPGSFEKT